LLAAAFFGIAFLRAGLDFVAGAFFTAALRVTVDFLLVAAAFFGAALRVTVDFLLAAAVVLPAFFLTVDFLVMGILNSCTVNINA